MANKSSNQKEYSDTLQLSPKNSAECLQIKDDVHYTPDVDAPQGGKYQALRKNVKMKELSCVIVLKAVPILFAAITLGWVIVPWFIRSQIENKIVLSPEANSELYSAWIKPPFPIYFKVYLFNVTNPEQVRLGALPHFEQVGPYVCLENRTKIDVSHNENSDTITYKDYISYHFQPHMSGNARLTDVVNIINVPFVAVATKIAELPWPIRGMALTLLATYKEPLFLKKTVDEAVFKGWTVPFLQKIEEDIGITLIPNNKFGLVVEQNDTAQGPYLVSRGTHDKSTIGKILKFRNESSLRFWEEDYCKQINATDGSLFQPFVTKESILRLFNMEICRSVYFTYDKDISYEGINGYRFVAPESVMEDPKKSDENSCFCPDLEEYPETCTGKGTLSLGPCKDGAPVAVSGPFFIDGEPDYQNMSGLTPIKDQHQSYIDVEPNTGLVFRASKKLQVNLILKRVKAMSVLKRVPEMLFPIFWAEEYFEVDAQIANKFKNTLLAIWLIDVFSKYVVLGLAVVVIFVLIVRKIVFGRRKFSKINRNLIK